MDELKKSWYAKYFIKLCNPHQYSNGTSNENGLATSQIILDITLVGGIIISILISIMRSLIPLNIFKSGGNWV